MPRVPVGGRDPPRTEKAPCRAKSHAALTDTWPNVLDRAAAAHNTLAMARELCAPAVLPSSLACSRLTRGTHPLNLTLNPPSTPPLHPHHPSHTLCRPTPPSTHPLSHGKSNSRLSFPSSELRCIRSMHPDALGVAYMQSSCLLLLTLSWGSLSLRAVVELGPKLDMSISLLPADAQIGILVVVLHHQHA